MISNDILFEMMVDIFLFFKKHIGGKAADFRPKAGSCAFS